jgi:hypothetical protein
MLDAAIEFKQRYRDTSKATKRGFDKIDTVILKIQAAMEAQRLLNRGGARKEDDPISSSVIDVSAQSENSTPD